MASARLRRDAAGPCHTGGAVSSAVLYLAIVALWAVVLVPMWLRRDSDAARHGLSWLPHRRPVTTSDPAQESAPEFAPESVSESALPESVSTPDSFAESMLREPGLPARESGEAPVQRPGHRGWRGRPERRGRGAVMARRRRRTWGLSLLVLAAVGGAFAGLVPYWSALPPAGLLAGHLSLLRVAAAIDAARREAIALARAAERAEARAARAAREAAAEAAQAQIIDLMARNRARDVFDQYAHEGLRVVGD